MLEQLRRMADVWHCPLFGTNLIPEMIYESNKTNASITHMQFGKKKHRRSKLALINDEPERKLRHNPPVKRGSSTASLLGTFFRLLFHVAICARRAMWTRWLRMLCMTILVGRYGVSVYGAIAYSAKSFELLRTFDFGLQMISCAVFGILSAVYCAYANDDLCTLLGLSLVRVNDALDGSQGGPLSCMVGIFAVIGEFMLGVLAHVRDVGNYRVLHELESLWNFACFLRFALRSIARGEFKALTKSLLQWCESQTQILHQLRHMWHALSEVVADIVHDASNMVHVLTRSIAAHLTRSWGQLSHWMERATRGAVTATSGMHVNLKGSIR
jgi:hypothetical protein